MDAETWSCSGCKKTEPADNYVNAVIRSIGEELVRLERGSPEACQNFIKKHSQNLHPNHYYLVTFSIIKRLNFVSFLNKQKCFDKANKVNKLRAHYEDSSGTNLIYVTNNFRWM